MVNLEEIRNSCPSNRNMRFRFKSGHFLDGRVIMLGQMSRPAPTPVPSNVAIVRSVNGEEFEVHGTELESAELIEKLELDTVKYYKISYDIFEGNIAVMEDREYYFLTKEDLDIVQIESLVIFSLLKKQLFRDNSKLVITNISEMPESKYFLENR